MDDQPSERDLPQDPADEPGDPRWDAVARDLAGEGDAASEATARAWRSEHPDEAAAVDALDRTLDRLAFTAPADLDVEAALRRVKARRAEAPQEQAHVLPFPATARPTVVMPARRRRWPVPGLAAAALLLVAGGVTAWRELRARRGGDVAGQTFATIVGTRDSVRLPDGTRVTLGPRSTLEVASDYGRGRREVRLRGEGYFAVAHDAAAPFVVRTEAASIHDVGTAFVVRDGTDGRVSVAVTEGTVLLHAAGTDSAAGVLVHARARGTVVPGRAPVVAPNAVTDDDLAWTRGQLAFHDAPFPEVAAELRRWYGLELRAADSSLVERHLTAAFHGEGPSEVLRVVALALGASVEQRGDTAFLRAAPASPPTP
jgi:transmembrane sensor